MATFTIKFEGIICHVGPDADKKTHAAIAHDADHDAKIKIPTQDITLVDGDTVTFSLAAGPATTDREFKRLVPSLEPLLADGSILGDVKTPKHVGGDGVVAFVIHPGGTLGAPQTFKHPADYAFSDDTFVKKHCVSAGVTLTIDDGGAAVVMTVTNGGTPKTYTIASGSTITIMNISSTGSTGGAHFDLYREKFTNGREIALPREDKKLKCKVKTSSIKFTEKAEAMKEAARKVSSLKGEDMDPADPNPDCSNSAWP